MESRCKGETLDLWRHHQRGGDMGSPRDVTGRRDTVRRGDIISSGGRHGLYGGTLLGCMKLADHRRGLRGIA